MPCARKFIHSGYMPRSYREPWLRYEGRWRGLKRAANRKVRRRSAYKRVRNGYWSIRGWMCYMFRRHRDGTPNKWHVIGSRK